MENDFVPLNLTSALYFVTAISTIQVWLSSTRVLGPIQPASQQRLRGRMEIISITWVLEVISILTSTKPSMLFLVPVDYSFKQVTGCRKFHTKWPDIQQLVIDLKPFFQRLIATRHWCVCLVHHIFRSTLLVYKVLVLKFKYVTKFCYNFLRVVITWSVE